MSNTSTKLFLKSKCGIYFTLISENENCSKIGKFKYLFVAKMYTKYLRVNLIAKVINLYWY